MTIQLFDLTDASRRIFFSPYCWRTRMALKHKGLAFENIPWHFTDTDKLEGTGSTRVPTIIDGATNLGESWDIAIYLDKTYADTPALMADEAARARAKFIESWCRTAVFPSIVPIAVPSVFKIIADKDTAYFRESRERMLNTTLETLSKDPVAETAALGKVLQPAADALKQAPFLAGRSPDYADYVLFGTLMWPYMVCPENPLDMTTPVGLWFGRMLDLHEGYARNAPRAADAA